MAQSLRPVADVAVGGGFPNCDFGDTPWWSKLDDESDATFVTGLIDTISCFLVHMQVKVDTIAERPANTGQTIVRIRVRIAQSTAINALDARILNGASVIATITMDPYEYTTGEWADVEYIRNDLNWSTADLSDISVRISGVHDGGSDRDIDIARLELEVPDPVAAPADGTPENVQVVCGMEDCGVTWDRPDDPDGNPVTGYEIERCDGESGDCMDEEDFTKVGETDAPDETSFDDDNPPLPPIDPDTVPSPTGEPYCYRVRSILTVGFSPYSDIVCATSTPRVYGNNAAILTEPARGPYTRYRGKPTSYN
jgi:hypothetical protein